MSFPNTKTHLKPTCKPKYTVPIRDGKRGTTEFYLTPELEKEFRRLYPTTLNIRMMEMFGISHSTLHKFARKYKLTKDIKVIRHKQAQLAKKICEKNGYYDSLRGHAPSQQCHDAYQEYLHSERYKHPMRIMKEKSKKHYNAICRKRSEERKKAIRIDIMRLDAGLKPRTNLHLPFTPYSRKQTCLRHAFFKTGYILGSIRDEDNERFSIFYDNNTERHLKREQNAIKVGFKILPL